MRARNVKASLSRLIKKFRNEFIASQACTLCINPLKPISDFTYNIIMYTS
jgi:hypothetical protein